MHRNQTAVVVALCLLTALACSAPLLATPTPLPTATPTPTLTPTVTPTLTPTSTPQPVVIASGTVQIPQTYMADLDTGIVPRDAKNPAFADVDLWFDAVSSTERYLEPYNGASMTVMGLTQVGFNECRNLQAAVARVDINNLPAGTYICVSTNIKNTALVRVATIDYSSPGSIRLDFMTWHQP
jgi:hypothetical protein